MPGLGAVFILISALTTDLYQAHLLVVATVGLFVSVCAPSKRPPAVLRLLAVPLHGLYRCALYPDVMLFCEQRTRPPCLVHG